MDWRNAGTLCFGSVPGSCCTYLRLADSSRLTPDAHSATTKLSKLNFRLNAKPRVPTHGPVEGSGVLDLVFVVPALPPVSVCWGWVPLGSPSGSFLCDPLEASAPQRRPLRSEDPTPRGGAGPFLALVLRIQRCCGELRRCAQLGQVRERRQLENVVLKGAARLVKTAAWRVCNAAPGPCAHALACSRPMSGLQRTADRRKTCDEGVCGGAGTIRRMTGPQKSPGVGGTGDHQKLFTWFQVHWGGV